MNPILKVHQEAMEEFEKRFADMLSLVETHTRESERWHVSNFLASYHNKLLDAVKEAGPEKASLFGVEAKIKTRRLGFNSAISSFPKAIDEGRVG